MLINIDYPVFIVANVFIDLQTLLPGVKSIEVNANQAENSIKKSGNY